MPRSSSLTRLLLTLSLLGMARCAPSPAMQAVDAGRYEGLRATVSAEIEQGRFDARDAILLAKAVARGEIERAQGPDGAQRIRDLVSCASEIDGALERRATTHDALGAVAAAVRVDAGLASADMYARWARVQPGAPGASMRALGARALTTNDDGELRRRLIADPDEEVRRGALRAAGEVADDDDAEAILEAARLDPNPGVQRQAIRAAGSLGGERVALALRDLWARADDETRQGIVEAWGSAHSLDSGGREGLVWAATTQRGQAAVAAAVTLLRAHKERASEAVGVVERAVKEGPTADRVHAIEVAPLVVPPLREAVEKAESDADETVATAARVRMLEAPVDLGGAAEGSAARAALIAKLMAVASGGAPASTPMVASASVPMVASASVPMVAPAGTPKVAAAGTSGGSEAATLAKGALARAGVKELAPILERDGAAPSVKTRAEAGTALAVLGDVRRAAVIAVDPDPRVRVTVSCAILRAWAHR